MSRDSKKAFPLARRELEFMNVVWDLDEATAQQVQEALRKKGRKLRESTVRTIHVLSTPFASWPPTRDPLVAGNSPAGPLGGYGRAIPGNLRDS